jgi:hypothetical protein
MSIKIRQFHYSPGFPDELDFNLAKQGKLGFDLYDHKIRIKFAIHGMGSLTSIGKKSIRFLVYQVHQPAFKILFENKKFLQVKHFDILSVLPMNYFASYSLTSFLLKILSPV